MSQRARPYLIALSARQFRRAERSNHLNIGRLRAFLPLRCHERNSLVLFEAFMPGALNIAVVSEEVLATRLGRNKAEAFVVVEPLHDTDFCFQCMS